MKTLYIETYVDDIFYTVDVEDDFDVSTRIEKQSEFFKAGNRVVRRCDIKTVSWSKETQNA